MIRFVNLQRREVKDNSSDSMEDLPNFISALDGTYLRTGFENIIQLIPLAEKVKKLQAICKECC